MTSQVLKETEMEISPELRRFGELVKFIDGRINAMQDTLYLSEVQRNYFLARGTIADYDRETVRKLDLSDVVGLRNSRLKSYFDLIDSLRERLDSEYERLEAQTR